MLAGGWGLVFLGCVVYAVVNRSFLEWDALLDLLYMAVGVVFLFLMVSAATLLSCS